MSNADNFTQINDIKEFSKRVDKALATVENREPQELSKYFDSIGEYISNRNITPEHRSYALLLVKEASECSRNKKDGRFIQAISQAPRLLQSVYAIASFEHERDFPNRGSCYFKDKFRERYVLEEEQRLEEQGSCLIQLAMEMIFYWKTFYRFQAGQDHQGKTNFEILYDNFKSLGEKAKAHLYPYEKDQSVLEFFAAERQELKVLKNEKYPLQIVKEVYGTHLCVIYHQDLRNKLSVAENKIGSLELNIKKLMGEKNELNTACENSKRANQTLALENENLNKKLEQRATEISQLKNMLEKNLKQLAQDNTKTKEELNLKNNEIGAVTKDKDTLIKNNAVHKLIPKKTLQDQNKIGFETYDPKASYFMYNKRNDQKERSYSIKNFANNNILNTKGSDSDSD